MAKLWSDLHDYYLNEISGCPYVTAANALRMAAQELCERAKVWRVQLDPVIMVADVATYDFDITADQEVVKIMSAKLDGSDFPVLLYEQRGNTSQRGMIVLNPIEFMVQPLPATGQSLVMQAILKPSNEADEIEDFLYSTYAKTIAEGAKAHLFGMADQPFSNPVMAIAAREKFDTAIARATISSAKAFSGAPLRTAPSFM